MAAEVAGTLQSSPCPVDEASAMPLTLESTTRPRMSSMTAAPRTRRASCDCPKRRSLKTRAVMPTLVAHMAAPRNMLLIQLPSGRISGPTKRPPAMGNTTPTTAMMVARPPTASNCGTVDSSPTSNSSTTTPSWASSSSAPLEAISGSGSP